MPTAAACSEPSKRRSSRLSDGRAWVTPSAGSFMPVQPKRQARLTLGCASPTTASSRPRRRASTPDRNGRTGSCAGPRLHRDDDNGQGRPKPWSDDPLTGRLVLADGTVIAGQGLGATGSAGRRGVLQHGHDRLPGDPHRSLLRRPDHHLHLPPHRQRRHQPRGHRDLQPRHALGRARLRAARRRHRALQLPRAGAARPMAEGAWHHGHRRRRHPCADRAHPREGHAQRRDRARAVRQVRPRQAQGRGQGVAGPAGAGSRAGGHRRPELHLGRDALGLGQGLRPAGEARLARRRRRLRPQAQHPALPGGRRAARSRWCRPPPAPRTSSSASPTACSCPTAPAIRPPPASTPCRRSRSWSPPACRCSASASATRCWGWRSAPRPRRCTRATTARTIR